MILGAKARYAVMAMADLASRDGGKSPVTLADLAEAQEIPLPYLEQIFARLRKEALVSSVRGPGGGYVLARTAESIRISDIVLAVDEPIKMTRCESHVQGGCLSGKARCRTHDLWEGLSSHIFSYLEGVSLQDLCSPAASSVFLGEPAEALFPMAKTAGATAARNS